MPVTVVLPVTPKVPVTVVLPVTPKVPVTVVLAGIETVPVPSGSIVILPLVSTTPIVLP